MVFGVHWNDAAAEAYRLNPMAFPKMAAVAARAQVAIETASGCKVRSIGGDPAIVKAKLDCKGALPRQSGVRVETGDCYADESWRVEALGREYTGIQCQLTVTSPG